MMIILGCEEFKENIEHCNSEQSQGGFSICLLITVFVTVFIFCADG